MQKMDVDILEKESRSNHLCQKAMQVSSFKMSTSNLEMIESFKISKNKFNYC